MTWALAKWKLLVAGAIALAIVSAAWLLFSKGKKEGAAMVRSAVQTETIHTIDNARISKEKTDEEVVHTPYDNQIDGLR